MRYVELKSKPINPNRAKYYSLLLSAVAALIAIMTLKSNYDYFSQYYEGAGFWMRIIPFYSVELAIIALPLTKGWGNHHQVMAALFCEVPLILLTITHTSMVNQAGLAKIQAGRTKSEAQADLAQTQAYADKITEQNHRAQKDYQSAMLQWRRAANIARKTNQSPPPPPLAPTLQTVPVLNQRTVDNSTLSTSQASEAEVSHVTLGRLLYAMIGLVIAASILVVWLADASKVKAWLLRRQAVELYEAMQLPFARVIDSDEPYTRKPPEPTPVLEAIPLKKPPALPPANRRSLTALPSPPRKMLPRAIGFAPSTVQPVEKTVVPPVQSVVPTVEPISLQSKTVEKPVEPASLLQSKTLQSKTVAPPVETYERLGLFFSPTKGGGYSIASDQREYLCYSPKKEVMNFSTMDNPSILACVKSRVGKRKDGGNKLKAVSEINRLIGLLKKD